MGIPRVYAPTPLFLSASENSGESSENRLHYPFFNQEGIGTPLFPKGRSCLSFVLKLYKLMRPDRDEVIIPAYNAQSLAFAAMDNSLKIRLVDIDEQTFFPTYYSYKTAITDKTLAAILPYNWGIFPALSEIKKIHELLLNYNVLWIDDFATSVPMGAYADYFKNYSPCTFYSFGKTKILTIMDGGYAFFSSNHQYFLGVSELLIKEVAKIRKHPVPRLISAQRFITNIAYHLYTNRLGFSVLSLLGLTQKDRIPLNAQVPHYALPVAWELTLKHIIDKYFDTTVAERLRVSHEYFRLSHKYSFSCFMFPTTRYQIGSRFPMLFPSMKARDHAIKLLTKKNIGVSTGHQQWLGNVDLLKFHLADYSASEFPNAISFQDRLLTLPLHGRVSDSDVSDIADILNDCFS